MLAKLATSLVRMIAGKLGEQFLLEFVVTWRFLALPERIGYAGRGSNMQPSDALMVAQIAAAADDDLNWTITMFLTAKEILLKGLHYAGVRLSDSSTTNEDNFHAHYGSESAVVALIWYDLRWTDIPAAKLDAKEDSESGLLMFFAALYYLWTYPKNTRVFASRFDLCERLARGEPLWKWIKKIEALKDAKIVWPTDRRRRLKAIDCMDHKTWEKKHPTYPIDRTYFSQKTEHAGVKYEIVTDPFQSKCLRIVGPIKCGKNDITVFREGEEGGESTKDIVLNEPPESRTLFIADKGYRTSERDELGLFSTPNPLDPPELKNFKTRVRMRHETFNGRLKFFRILYDIFHHDLSKHKAAFIAVAVIVQYQMDHGAKLYDP